MYYINYSWIIFILSHINLIEDDTTLIFTDSSWNRVKMRSKWARTWNGKILVKWAHRNPTYKEKYVHDFFPNINGQLTNLNSIKLCKPKPIQVNCVDQSNSTCHCSKLEKTGKLKMWFKLGNPWLSLLSGLSVVRGFIYNKLWWLTSNLSRWYFPKKKKSSINSYAYLD